MNPRGFAVLAVAASCSCGGVAGEDGASTGSPAPEPDAGEPCHERTERGWAIVRAAPTSESRSPLSSIAAAGTLTRPRLKCHCPMDGVIC